MSLLGSRPVSWRCPRSMCWIWVWRSVWSPTLVLWMSPYLTRSSFLSSTATSPWTSILKVRFLTNQLLHFTVIVALLIVKQLEHLVSKSTCNNKTNFHVIFLKCNHSSQFVLCNFKVIYIYYMFLTVLNHSSRNLLNSGQFHFCGQWIKKSYSLCRIFTKGVHEARAWNDGGWKSVHCSLQLCVWKAGTELLYEGDSMW